MTIQSKKEKETKEFEIEKDKNLLEMEKAIALIVNKALEEGNKVKGVLGIIDDVQALLEAIIQRDIQAAERYVIKFSGLGEKISLWKWAK